jgi:hypothetical protein
MNTIGIRISDKDDHYLVVTLHDILEEISEGKKYKWAILFLNGVTDENQEIKLFDLQEKITNSNNCLLVCWEKLIQLSTIFDQIYEIVILGCLEAQNLKNYKDNKEMYTSCDIVIELIDCSWWEVFSKDPFLIQRYASKFKNTKPLDITHAS